MIDKQKRPPGTESAGAVTQVRTLREQSAGPVRTLRVLLALVVSLTACAGSPPQAVTGRVTRVIDGDTIIVDGVGTVRYIGVDTPELHHPDRPVERFAIAAWRANRQLVAGSIVRVEFEQERRDAYGRTLGDVFVGETFVNAHLVRLGLGRTLAIRPNVDHADELRRLERAARRAHRGMWGSGQGGVPWGRFETAAVESRRAGSST